jgi:hypothetical protein
MVKFNEKQVNIYLMVQGLDAGIVILWMLPEAVLSIDRSFQGKTGYSQPVHGTRVEDFPSLNY